MFGLPLTRHLLCTSLTILHCRKPSRLVHGRHYGVGLSVEVGLGLLPLYLWWGKPQLVTSWSCRGLVVVPKAIAMAHLSAVASPFAILPPRPSRFCPLARYFPLSSDLSASPPPWLAPYCYSPAGTLLLGACARLSILFDGRDPPWLRPAMVLHGLHDCRQRPGQTM